MTQENIQQQSVSVLNTSGGEYIYYRLGSVEESGMTDLSRLPVSIRVLLENAIRNMDGRLVTGEDVAAVASWKPNSQSSKEFPFMPARVCLLYTSDAADE